MQVTLPPRAKVDAPEKQWSLASCSSWQSVAIGPLAPISFEIHAVVVELEPDEPLTTRLA